MNIIEHAIKSTWDITPDSIKPLADNQISRLVCGLSLFGGIRYYKHYRRLLKAQWWPIEKIEEHRLVLLKKILNHAYSNIPFYNGMFKKEGLIPRKIPYLESLGKLPIISKEDVLREYEKFFPITIEKSKIRTLLTGGSTGKPLIVSYDNDFWGFVSATERIIKGIAGFDDFSLRVSIPGNGPFYKRTNDFFEYNPVTRQLFFSCSMLSDKVFKDYVRIIKRFGPKYMDLHPSVAYYFAKFLNEKGINDITFDSVLCSGEVLHDFQRRLIKKQFNCEVFDYYGQVEMLCLATECEQHDGMHVNELGMVEVVDKNGVQLKPGMEGRIVATTLYNYAWPLIRYDTGDIGSIEMKLCRCGRGFMRIKKVQGRCNDMIRLPDGRIIPPNYFTTVMEKFAFAKQFQFVQEDDKNLILKIVKKGATTKMEIGNLKNFLKKLTDNKLDIHMKCVDNIELYGRKNKYRYVISNVEKSEK